MLRLRRVSVPVLVALALLALAGPAAAHVAAPPPAAALQATDANAIIPILSAAPAPPALPWYLAAGLALGALTAWRRPRRALVVTLVLLLCVFAFEDALHSVHHGFDVQQQEQCTVAAASAQLSAVQVDGIGLCSGALPVIGEADTARPAFALTRFLNPDQERAPPSATL
ncbi:MAG: hypothetical protein ACREKG_15285 [Candidatus Rokuibacteriota bacterium]